MTGEDRFFDGRTGAAQPVSVHLRDGVLTVQTADGALAAAWPAQDVRQVDAAAAGGETMLRRDGGVERLVVHDPALVAALREAGARTHGGALWSQRSWLGLGAGFLLAIGVAALLVDRLPDVVAPLVPHRLEVAWSDQFLGVLDASAAQCSGAAGQAALDDLMARLAKGAGLAAAPPLQVVDTRLVNAFTLPDGRVVLLSGLISAAEDQDELAGVLAHELGHVRHRDPTREMVRRTALNMIARSLGWGGGLATTMTALSYGRVAEGRADASAIDTLHAAGLRADGLGRFFVYLQRRTGGDATPAYLSDHPATADRAARLRQPPTGAHALSDDAWQDVRGMCGAE